MHIAQLSIACYSVHSTDNDADLSSLFLYTYETRTLFDNNSLHLYQAVD